MNQISTTLHSIASDIYKELGSGFDEVPLQSALAIEFRERKIPYLKEVNIELFYKGQNIGTLFLILCCFRVTVKTGQSKRQLFWNQKWFHC